MFFTTKDHLANVTSKENGFVFLVTWMTILRTISFVDKVQYSHFIFND